MVFQILAHALRSGKHQFQLCRRGTIDALTSLTGWTSSDGFLLPLACQKKDSHAGKYDQEDPKTGTNSVLEIPSPQKDITIVSPQVSNTLAT